MKKNKLLKALIGQILKYPGFIMVWKYLTEKQRNIFLKNFIETQDIESSLEETVDVVDVDEEEDTEET